MKSISINDLEWRKIEKRGNITIYDIAKEAKVSPSTVSRVLTGNAKVRPETMKRITNIIEKYNFRPNSLARSLLYKQSKMIGFIVPDIKNPFFSTLVLEGEAHALNLGYSSFLCNTRNDLEVESQYLQNLIDKQVDGILFLGGRINNPEVSEKYIKEMQEVVNRIPMVFINGEMPGVEAHTVRTNEGQGINSLVDLLVSQGHVKIGFIGGSAGVSSMSIKMKSFIIALKELGIEVNHEWMIAGSFSIESGEKSIEELLKLKDRPTALICVNDFVAIGVIKRLNKKGYEVPNDFSVVGFDDIYLANHFPPGITTISQSYENLGKTAVNVLVDLINRKQPAKETIINTNLITRNSTQTLKN